ncbi:TPA: hypothetical protein N3G98_004565 [Salmonella enterica subsp. enterica serovar Denver]|nr:hypothetical protein [Salmonella enterica subsp. enterica serovar Denver]ECD5429488.1 hypothetical protein [Salmonella enterica subsp. enterica serovar Denver]HCM3794376.1 hypothetical protein [Salmonella enterica subsp. enterica serovar Denver]
MKIAITSIMHDEHRVRGIASVEYDYLIAPVTVCNIPVSVGYVEGKSLEQYQSELEGQAREIISGIYKEIVCGGKLDEEIIIPVRGKLTGEYKIRVVNKNGKLSVAGLDGEASDILDFFRGKIEPSTLSDELLSKIDGVTKASGSVMACGVLNGERVMVVRAPDISGPVRTNKTHSNHSLEERVIALEKRLDAQIEPGALKATYHITVNSAQEI